MKEMMLYDTDYYQLREFVLERMLEIIKTKKKKCDVVFYGDSITEYCDLDLFYPEIKSKFNAGIAGITSDMLLHFIDEGVIKHDPKKVVIMVGTNDLGDTVMHSPRQIALNIKDMVDIIQCNLPNTKVYIVSPIPCIESLHGYKAMKKGMRSNDMIKMIFKECKKIIRNSNVTFIPIYQSLCNKKGLPIEQYYVDGLHLNQEGYKVYTNKIKEILLK